MRISVSTWNANEFLQRRRRGLDLASWLQRADDKAAGSNPDEAPAIYAIALQETVLLPNALVGIGAAQLSRYESIIKDEIDSHVASAYAFSKASSGEDDFDSKYSLVSKRVSGGVALLIYVRQSLSSQISEVLTAYMPCGPLWMSNKGAVGIRLTLSDPGRTSFTFLSCHLAPHDHNAERRNADWATIVSGLTFTSPSTGKQHQIYDTTFLFVAGDLNYRLSRTHPERLTLTQIGERLSPNRLPELLAHDQLRIEQQKGNTLYGLQEGEIKFPPSYKFVKGTDRYKNFADRVPAWCDRVMYAGPASDSVTVEQYRSTTSIRTSDHKPVSALFRIQLPSSSQSSTLSVRSPYPVDPQAPLKRALGLVLSKVVGAVWAILRTIGFGSPWIGATILLLHTAAVILDFDYIGHLQALWHWLRTADKKEAYDNFAMATTDRVQAFIDERTDIFFGPFKGASKQS